MLNIIQYQGSLNLGCEYLKTIAIWSTNSLQEKTKLFEYPGLNFTYGVENLILYQCLKIPNLRHEKWWFSTSRGLRKMTTWYCYKMKIGFYHEVTWRGNSATTKWRLVFIIKLLEGDTPPLQNEDWCLYVFHHQVTWREHFRRATSLPTKWDWVFTFVFRWANSLATKWHSIFKGLSATETLKTYKMQFPCCGYNMPGPSPFFHLNLSPEMPLKRGTRPPIL